MREDGDSVNPTCLFPHPIIAPAGVMRWGVRHGVLAVGKSQAFDGITWRRNVLSGCKKEGRVNTVEGVAKLRISSPMSTATASAIAESAPEKNKG